MMPEMVRDINAKFGDGKAHVARWTCHRASTTPQIAKPSSNWWLGEVANGSGRQLIVLYQRLLCLDIDNGRAGVFLPDGSLTS